MRSSTIPILAVLLAPLAALYAAEATKPQDRLNVIVILADDLGYECIGANGGKSYRTPYVDRLAREGVRFEHCYAQPNCTPTRVQLMTGMSNLRNYVSFGELAKSQTTFGHIFSRAGYATCIAGKWQLGSKDPGLPKHFGFDEHCLWAHMGRGERYADPSLSVQGELKTFAGRYGPDVCQDFVVDFIRRNRSKPFFVYYPMILTHGGYEATPDSADWGKPTAKARELGQRHFTDMVAYMDKQIGALTQELEALGLLSTTLILFTGDNGTGRGAVSELEGVGEIAGEKGSTTRGGMHVPLIASWPGRIATGKVCPDLVDMTDVLPTLCEATGVRAGEARVRRAQLPAPASRAGRTSARMDLQLLGSLTCQPDRSRRHPRRGRTSVQSTLQTLQHRRVLQPADRPRGAIAAADRRITG